MLPLCVVMLIFHNRTSAKNPDFRQKSAQNTEIFPQKTLFYIYTTLFRFSTTPPQFLPLLKCASRGYPLEGTQKSGLTTEKTWRVLCMSWIIRKFA